MYTFKEWMEISAAALTIIVSIIAIYGLTTAVRKKVFKRMHDVLEHIEEKIKEGQENLLK